MEKLSGLVLDVYDDAEGGVLRSLFSSQEEVPDLIKEARYINPEEHRELPDDVFALVLHNDGACLRKYACTDGGNTALSVEYFLKTAHKLPAEAQKVAAENLVRACGWYGIEPPEQLHKVALGLGSALSIGGAALTAPEVIKGTSQEIKKNQALSQASGGAVNPAIAGIGPQQPGG